jgi:hypothetical protein
MRENTNILRTITSQNNVLPLKRRRIRRMRVIKDYGCCIHADAYFLF